jgi:hypothetical protein
LLLDLLRLSACISENKLTSDQVSIPFDGGRRQCRAPRFTLLGDLNQQLCLDGEEICSWDDLYDGVGVVSTAAIYRQPRGLGEFVSDYRLQHLDHRVTRCANSEAGKKPRCVTCDMKGAVAIQSLARLVCEEYQHWRSIYTDCRVTVVVDDRFVNRERCVALAVAIRGECDASEEEVQYVEDDIRDEKRFWQRPINVVGLSLLGGLSLDVVVYCDLEGLAFTPESTTSRKRGLYVAISRAQRGLSMILDRTASLNLQSLQLCELIERP